MGGNHEQRQDTPSEQACRVSMTGGDTSNEHNHERMAGLHHQATRVNGGDCG